jgi:predicted LPLAT superfamily acyltransferase
MSDTWKQRPEGGGLFALGLIRGVARHGGRSLARLLLYPITLYFLLRRAPERKASRAWLGRALGRQAGLLDVARHIHTFASTILDRVFLLSGQLRRFKIRVQGLEALHDQLLSGQGLLLFGSHLGSFEVLRVLSRERPDIQVRVVLDIGHNPAMTQLLDALNPGVAATVIDAGDRHLAGGSRAAWSSLGAGVVLWLRCAAADGTVADRIGAGCPGHAGLRRISWWQAL